MITIGNPIFDSVFKFFLADDTAARILLSALIKQKVSVEKKGFKMQFDDTLAEGDSDMQKIVNRLSMVFTDDHTTELMIAENEEYQEHLDHLAAKEELAEKKEQIAEQNVQIAEQKALISAKEQELAQQKKQLEDKDKQFDSLLSSSINMLASAGISHEQIAKNLNITVDKVEELISVN